MGESTGRLCVSKFCRGIFNNENIRATYLRSMTKSDARRVSRMHSKQHGVSGMLGSLDCMQVYWENCPYEQKGQHAGKEKKPTLALEAVADYSLWFWHHDFGFPGALNDINIWDRSELCKSFVDGTLNQLDFVFLLNDEERTFLYYLVDGIYPELARFVKTIATPLTKKESKFASWQEAKRKDIERAFGVLQKKFNFLNRPVRMFAVDDIFYVVKACIALHNMMVEVRMDNDEEEHVDFYEEVVLKDPAVEAVEKENEMFEQNADRLDVNGPVLDLKLLEKFKKAELLGDKIRMAEKRWKHLTDPKQHAELTNAVINHLFPDDE
jgi:hypothetical protein